MPEYSARLRYLYDRYINDTGTAAEMLEFWSLIREYGEDELLQESVFRLYEETRPDPNHTIDWTRSMERIMNQPLTVIPLAKKPVRAGLRKYAFLPYAAAILLLIGLGTFIWHIGGGDAQDQVAKTNISRVAADVLPGSDRAMLTLSDGRRVALNDSNETLSDGAVKIIKSNGALAYDKSDVVAYNTMTTPRGGQYKLVLADGTRVWLNAASSITYPTSFLSEHREVSISGEVYFEVAKDKTRPFRVAVKSGEVVEALGTQFNVNAYEDEPSMKTSLLEGSVRIGQQLLKPGDIYTAGRVVPGNVEQAIAWKNGMFNFQDKGLQEVMRQLSRWYDITVVYEKEAPPIEFFGKMGRNLSLSQALSVLEGAGVSFKLEEGKRLIVMPEDKRSK